MSLILSSDRCAFRFQFRKASFVLFDGLVLTVFLKLPGGGVWVICPFWVTICNWKGVITTKSNLKFLKRITKLKNCTRSKKMFNSYA